MEVKKDKQVTCTITNTYDGPRTGKLTLVKIVSSGNDQASAWTLYADGETDIGGVTGRGSVTDAEVSPGTYTLSESGPQGYTGIWSCEETSDKSTVVINDNQIVIEAGDDIICTVTNTYTPDPEVPLLHFIKVVCDEYEDVYGNKDADKEDDTVGKYTLFKNYPNFGGIVKPVSPNEIPKDVGCSQVDGWKFKLATDLPQNQNIKEVGPTTGGEFVTPISGEGSALTEAQQEAIRDGQLWISEVEQPGYGFATIRCYNDALNGDNLEYITLGNDNPEHIYCIAYNVPTEPQEPPCEKGPTWAASVVSNPQGKRKDGSDVLAGRSDPNLAVGAADWVSGTGTNFYSLGFGGSITLSFSGYVTNEPGYDLSFHEVTNGTYPDERLSIEVSQDGSTWYPLTTQATNTDPNHVSYVDFNETGLNWIKFVRLTDTSNPALFSNDADGFDLDAVDATNQECEPPVVEEECQQYDLVDRIVALVVDTKGVQCSISGFKYRDVNENGIIDDKDLPVPGWQIYLNDGDGGCTYDSGEQEPTVTTDEDGKYEFTNLPKGKYYVCERQQNGWDQVLPANPKYHEVTLSGSSVKDINFLNTLDNDKCEVDEPDYGFNPESKQESVESISIQQYNYSVSGCKFYGSTDERLAGWRIYIDLNKDGTLDGNEPYDDTDSTGYYKINFLSGYYSLPFQVREVLQSGWEQTYPVSPLYHELYLGYQDQTATGIHFRNIELPQPCSEPIDLIKNGSFENPLIGNQAGWNVFPSGTLGLEWLISWTGLVPDNYDGDTKPNPANIELHGGVNGWLPSAGSQYAELDSDWEGPSGNTSNEPANTSLTQIVDVPTGSVFKLSFDFSPRPNVASNVIEVYWNGALLGTVNEDGTGNGNTVWTTHTYSVTGAAGDDTLEFREVGNPDSLGSFLDNVKLVGCDEEVPGGDDSSSTRSGSRTDRPGRVLGDSTGLPYQAPQVLGATTELPRTGTPLAIAFSLFGLLAIVMIPKFVKIKN